MSLSKKKIQKTDELFDKACNTLSLETVENAELIDTMQGLTVLQSLMDNYDELYTKQREERINRVMYCMKGEFDKRGLKFKMDKSVVKDSIKSFETSEELRTKINQWIKTIDN